MLAQFAQLAKLAQLGLENTTMHSYMPVRSSVKNKQQVVRLIFTVLVEFCPISSIFRWNCGKFD